MAHDQKKVANQGSFDLFVSEKETIEIQTILKDDDISTVLYKNSLEVDVLTPGAIKQISKFHKVTFVQGKYLIQW